MGVAHPDVVALQENGLKAGDHVVCDAMYDGQGRRYTKAWAPGVPLVVHRGMSVTGVKQVGTKGRREVYAVATKKGTMVIINVCHTERRCKDNWNTLLELWTRISRNFSGLVMG